jgi:predicted dehydrogenase
MNIQPTQPGLFWYGIHAVEALYTILGKGCLQVTAVSNDDHELVVGLWRDGRVGTVRGNRKGNKAFGALIHREGGTRHIDTKAHPKPSYAGLLERVMAMFRTREANLDAEETLEIIRFIEAANESRSTGRTVRL